VSYFGRSDTWLREELKLRLNESGWSEGLNLTIRRIDQSADEQIPGKKQASENGVGNTS
jgi:hypothetical protein